MVIRFVGCANLMMIVVLIRVALIRGCVNWVVLIILIVM